MLTALLPALACHGQKDSITTSYDIKGVEVRAVRGADDVSSMAPLYSLDASDFSRLNISDVTSAIRRLPGVTLRDYGGAGGMKTISVRGMGSTHTGVALDGLLLSDIQSGQVDLQQFQLSEISSLSLSATGLSDIFQPARNFSKSALLSVETAAEPGMGVTLDAGSWGLVSPSVSFCHRIRRVVLSLQGGYTQADNDYPFTVENGVDTHEEKRSNSEMKQGYANLSALWLINAGTSLKTTVRWNDGDRELPGIVHLYTNENDETLRDRGILAQAQLLSMLSPKWRVRGAIRWNLTEQKYHNGIPSGGIRSERYLQREYYATASVMFTPVKPLSLSYSADWWRNGMRTTISSNPSPKRDSFLQALSARWESGRLSVFGQVLNSNISSEHHFSPSAGASYRLPLKDELYVRLMLKESFRMPTMTEMYYYHLGSQDLQPETTKQINLGLSFRHLPVRGRGLGVEISANGYINKVDDKIVAIPFNMFVWRYLNLEEVKGKGVDLMADVSWGFSLDHSLSLTANYSLQEIKNQPTNPDYSPLQIAYTPLHSGSATLGWENPWFGLSSTLLFASRTWTTNEHNTGTRIAGYGELGASVYKTIRIRRCEIDARVTVQNILDHGYCIIAHYPMPGRNWRASLGVRF